MLRRTASRLSAAAAPSAAASNVLRPADQQRTFTQAVHDHKANGTDLAAQMTSEFVSIQVQLLKYRVVRFHREATYLLENPSAGIPSWYCSLFHLVALFAVMNVAWMAGRMDIAPLERPAVVAAA